VTRKLKSGVERYTLTVLRSRQCGEGELTCAGPQTTAQRGAYNWYWYWFHVRSPPPSLLGFITYSMHTHATHNFESKEWTRPPGGGGGEEEYKRIHEYCVRVVWELLAGVWRRRVLCAAVLDREMWLAINGGRSRDRDSVRSW